MVVSTTWAQASFLCGLKEEEGNQTTPSLAHPGLLLAGEGGWHVGTRNGKQVVIQIPTYCWKVALESVDMPMGTQ